MSGGRFEYFYLRLEELAKDIAPVTTEEERELSNLLLDLSAVLHDLEWWKSGDIGYEDFCETWIKFKKVWLKSKMGEKSRSNIKQCIKTHKNKNVKENYKNKTFSNWCPLEEKSDENL